MKKRIKLTQEVIAEIGKLVAEGKLTKRAICGQFDISRPTLYLALKKFEAYGADGPPNPIAVAKGVLEVNASHAVNDALTDKGNVQQAGRLGFDLMKSEGIIGNKDGLNLHVNQIFASVPEEWRGRYVSSDEVRRIENDIVNEERENNRRAYLEQDAVPSTS